MAKLRGKVVLVTGGARGIGQAIVRRFSVEGATVIALDILDDASARSATDCGGSVSFHHMDVVDEGAWDAVVHDVARDHNRIDVLVNNAAEFLYAPIDEVEPTSLRRLLDVNLVGPSLGIAAVAPFMKAARQGSIVNIGSVDALQGAAGMSSYNASKWGLRGLSRCAALELGPWGVRVNAVHPGTIDTAMLNPLRRPVAEVILSHPRVALSRIGDVDEVAGTVVFLASDDASYISGADLTVDGGFVAGHYYRGKPEPSDPRE